MAENTKYVARIPIIPDDLSNSNLHKNHELVMDFSNEDLYVKKDNEYINITEKIIEEIEHTGGGGTNIKIVTDETLPDIADRPENTFYFVITDVENKYSEIIDRNKFIYYGLIKEYSSNKDYALINQNIITGEDTISISLTSGHKVCFYVPLNLKPTFYNHSTHDEISATVEDRLYALNFALQTYVNYNVYVLDLSTAGNYSIDVELDIANYITITLSSNASIAGLLLPGPKVINVGDSVGSISDPIWTDTRWTFVNWSSSQSSNVPVNLNTYTPTSDTILYAWFTYNSNPSLVSYNPSYDIG